MARIDYDVFCFNRVLSVEVSEQNKEKAFQIIDKAYEDWQELESDECCEEYILGCLKSANIAFEELKNAI